MKRTRALLIKELAQLRRDKRLLGLLIAAPVIQLMVLGFAANTDIREITLGIRDNDHTYHSREYARSLAACGYFKPTVLTGSQRDDARLLVSGDVGLLLVIPTGFGRDLASLRAVKVQALVDGTDANFGVQGMNYLYRATALYGERLARAAARGAPPQQSIALPAVVAQVRAWYNPDLKSAFHMIPALMGVLLMVTTMIVTSMALVKEREQGTMEQIIVTPLRPAEIIVGKLLLFVPIGFLEVALALSVIVFAFGVPLRGSAVSLFVVSGLFLLSTLGLGLFVSTFVRTQQQAMLVAAFFVMLPFILLSGFIFPVENMPRPMQFVANGIPLRYYLATVRGIFLKGLGWRDFWPDALVLLGWGTGILGLAVMRFHKRLD